MPARRCHIMLNTKAGAAHSLRLTADSLRQRFKGEGHSATIDSDEDAPFEEWVGRALGSDVGEVNGRIFLHNVTVGFAPALAAKRELIRGRRDISATLDYLRYFLQRVFEARRIAIRITPSAGEARLERVPAEGVLSALEQTEATVGA